MNYGSKMKKQSAKILLLAALEATFILLYTFTSNSEGFEESQLIVTNSTENLKQETINILEAKGNNCHRKQNPFMVFSLKNMERRAPKIHKQVFVTKRMPKGNQVKLSSNEYTILKEWLNQLNSN